MNRRSLAFLAALLLFPLVGGCEEEGVELQDRTVRAGCGSCRFDLEEYAGCYWAVEVDGKAVPIRGPAVPADDDSHLPDGMCNVTREAVVSGTLYPTHFQATAIDLMPVEAAEDPDFTPEDVH